MERISNYQLFMLITLYEVGTTVIFGFTSGAGRSAWIPVLISTFIGILINIVYYGLYKMNPGLTVVQWYPAQFGKWIGVPIAWIYTLEFMYDAGRGINDLEILIPNTLLPRTPIWIIELIFILVLTYGLFNGIETIARLGELFLPVILFLYVLEVMLLCSSDIINVQYIKPFLGKGWRNILDAVWPLGITQTFGQTLEFTMLWPQIKDQNKILRTTILATLLSGFFIASLNIFAIISLGEATFARSLFPLYELIRLINVGDFIENLDAINVLYFLTTAFFKLYIHLFSALRGLQQLTYSKNNTTLIIMIVSIVFFLGMNMAESTSEHLTVGVEIIPYNLWLPLFYILPIILFIVSSIRRLINIKLQSKN
ncbi:MAG: endospore germination permease [Clostridiaceae bacterium]